MQSVPFITDIDFDKVTFSQAKMSSGGKVKVDILAPDGRKLMFQITPDVLDPLLCRFPIDIPKTPEEADNPRRGQSVIISDPNVHAALAKLDEAVVKAATKEAKEWLKAKPGFDNETAVRQRYKEVLFKRDGDEFHCMKFKVKCENAQYPTKLYKINGDSLVRNAATVSDLEARSCRVSPILSCSALWFIPGGQFGVFVQAEELAIQAGTKEGSSFSSKRPHFRILDEMPEEDEETGEAAAKQAKGAEE